MNVGQLLRVLAGLPDDMPVTVDDSGMGWMQNAALYLAPAHVVRRVSGTYLHQGPEIGGENCRTLVISCCGQLDAEIVDITPEPAWTRVVDAEAAEPDAACAFGTLSCACQEAAPPGSPAHRDEIARGIQDGLAEG